MAIAYSKRKRKFTFAKSKLFGCDCKIMFKWYINVVATNIAY